LVTSGFPFLLDGPDGSGIGSSGNGKWNYRTTTTGSSNTGPTVPPPGPDPYYWYTETSGTSLGEVFTMFLEYTLDASQYNYIIDFYYSNYGAGGGGECLVQYWNGLSWDTVQTIGWSTTDNSWHAATPIDLSSYNNSDGKIRWHFTTGGGTTFQNDFALDDITITAETASSSSSSLSSSSTSSSSSSASSSSSSSSSSISLSSGTWTWGQQTGVTTDYVLTFSNGRITPWLADEIEGSGDDEHIVANSDGSYIWSEPAYIGVDSNVHLNYNEYTGTRDDSRFGAILFRTGATRQACIATSWQNYDRSVPMNSLGWIQISFTINSLSSSSVSSSSSSSASLNCEWENYNGGLSDWDIAQDEGVDLASWNGSVWTSVIHHLDPDIGGSENGGASYIYLVPKSLWNTGYRPFYARITHNRGISDIGGPNPRLQILAADSSKIVDEDQYISNTIVPMSFGASGDMALFKFYHTGVTPMEISNIEFCNESSSSSSVSSSSSSTPPQTTFTWGESGTEDFSGVTQDAMMRKQFPTQNYGSYTTYHIFNTFTDARGLMKYDVSALSGLISASSQIISAKLYVQSTNHNGGDIIIDAHRILREWNQGNKNSAPATTGEMTWSSAKYLVELWGTEGCDNTANDRLAIISDTATVNASFTFFNWDVTVDVKDFFDGTTNYGWILKTSLLDTGTGTSSFANSRYSASQRPYLEINISV
jgi:hypothetical protein